jgi:hypothetical protein
MYAFLLIGWLLLLGVTGLALGLRPSRRDFPGRLLITLAFYSALVGLAGAALFLEGWSAALRSWFGDSEGIAVYLILETITALGILALTPLWAYVAGRTLRWYRSRSEPTAQANAGLVRDE